MLPRPPASLTRDCNTIGHILRNIRRLPDFPFVCHTQYNIGNGNIYLPQLCIAGLCITSMRAPTHREALLQ